MKHHHCILSQLYKIGIASNVISYGKQQDHISSWDVASDTEITFTLLFIMKFRQTVFLLNPTKSIWNSLVNDKNIGNKNADLCCIIIVKTCYLARHVDTVWFVYQWNNLVGFYVDPIMNSLLIISVFLFTKYLPFRL